YANSDEVRQRPPRRPADSVAGRRRGEARPGSRAVKKPSKKGAHHKEHHASTSKPRTNARGAAQQRTGGEGSRSHDDDRAPTPRPGGSGTGKRKAAKRSGKPPARGRR